MGSATGIENDNLYAHPNPGPAVTLTLTLIGGKRCKQDGCAKLSVGVSGLCKGL